MKWSIATVGILILGLIGIAVMLLFQNLTTSSENDYYLLKEITESAMFDAIDISYYRETGNVKIVREKFVENFTRRYAESTLFIGGKYIISFFDIMEEPPKVSLLVNTGVIDYQIYGEDTKANYDVLNSLSGIFEYSNNKKSNSQVYERKFYSKTYYSMPKLGSDGLVDVNQPFNIPNEISQREIKNGSINITFSNIRTSNNMEDILQALLYREIDWVKATREDEMRTNYYAIIDTSKYASSCDVNNIYFYDCKNNIDEHMQCDKYNNFWLHWDGKCYDGEEALLVFNMNFEYDEYEY